MKRLIALACMLLVACGYALHRDPELIIVDNQERAKFWAESHANRIDGWTTKNECCGSMEPVIVKNDYLVIKKEAWSDFLLGWICVYKAEWDKDNLTSHRFVGGDANGGFIASGDNVKTTEAQYRVHEKDYFGKVVAIYRAK